ncbi:unnamed protein product, partial [Schistosoma mattheei]
MCIAREETLMELYELIIKHTTNCQMNNETDKNYFSFIQLTGESGSGKSVLLASLIRMLLTKSISVNSSLVNPRVIYRMIGSSTMSLNLLNLLSYLCLELSTRMNHSSISDTYDGLRMALHTAIIEATYEQSSQQPLIIILDGIENLEVWLSEIEFMKHYELFTSIIQMTNRLYQPLQLKIIIQLYKYKKDKLKTILNDLKQFTNYDLFSSLIKYTKEFYGIKRVQFIIGNIILSRWGLTNEDLLNLYWIKLPLNDNYHHLNKQKRYSLQDMNYELCINDKIDRVYITYNWLHRFLHEFLYPLGIIYMTRSPPYGCYQLYNINQQLFQYWIEYYH